MNHSNPLYTIGYEGQTLEGFLRRLKQVGVLAVVDVRELPLSRKRGFSKRALAVALAEHDIAYSHMPALGCPKPVREHLKADGDWPRYVRDFGTYLATQGASIGELTKLTRATPCGLLCFEADFNRCHRSLVARAAAVAGGLPVVHITAETTIPDVVRRSAA